MKRTIKFRFYTPDNRMLEDHDGWVEGIGINEALQSSADYGYIIMQFTNRLDKNGKEIYEGDIVRWMSKEYNWDKPDGEELYFKENISFIEFDGSGFWVNAEDFGWEGENLWNWDEMEVIGNLYQNPELKEKFTYDRQS